MIFDLDKSIEGSMINFTFLAFSRVLVQILHLVTLAVITRQLGPEMYGKMSLFLMVTQFLYLITGSWTAVGYTRYSIHYSIEKKQVSEVLWCRSFIVLILVLLFGLMLII
jgi:O-antigen/teichoic acid export membrane protein